jgi:hypothetical protein
VPRADNGPPPPANDRRWLEPDRALFPSLEQRRYPVETEYTADEYVELIGTYSENIALPPAQQEELFRRLHARIAERGTVRKLLVFELTVAYRPR